MDKAFINKFEISNSNAFHIPGILKNNNHVQLKLRDITNREIKQNYNSDINNNNNYINNNEKNNIINK